MELVYCKPYNSEAIQYELPNHNIIGIKSDLDYLKISKRLRTVNSSSYKNHYFFYVKALIMDELSRFISSLCLPSVLLDLTIKRVFMFYEQLPKERLYRSIFYLVPVALYITALENFIFIKLSSVLEQIRLDKGNKLRRFNRVFSLVLECNPSIMRGLRNDDFRKKFILNFLTRFFPLNIVKKELDNNWSILKNMRDRVIIGVFLYLYLDCRRGFIIMSELGFGLDVVRYNMRRNGIKWNIGGKRIIIENRI